MSPLEQVDDALRRIEAAVMSPDFPRSDYDELMESHAVFTEKRATLLRASGQMIESAQRAA